METGRILLTASTGEAYAWLFELLSGAGDGRVLAVREPISAGVLRWRWTFWVS
jgi:hypothetical protein